MTDIHDCEGRHQKDPVRLISTPGQRRMVVLILRGAMDGLDAVQPYGDPALRTLRGTRGGVGAAAALLLTLAGLTVVAGPVTRYTAAAAAQLFAPAPYIEAVLGPQSGGRR